MEFKFQQQIGLVSDARQFVKKEVRLRTNMLYVQTKYNLLREEPEGFSKLFTEIFDNLPPIFDTYTPTEDGVKLTKEEAARRRAEAVEVRVKEIVPNIASLVGYFDIDPNRVLDMILDLFIANIADHWDFFVKLLEASPWRGGKSVCAQILGFKFDWYNGSTHGSRSVPENLVFVAAVMIKHGLINMGDFYLHLSPVDEDMERLYEDYLKDLQKQEKTAGRFRAKQVGIQARVRHTSHQGPAILILVQMAGQLSDDGVTGNSIASTNLIKKEYVVEVSDEDYINSSAFKL